MKRSSLLLAAAAALTAQAMPATLLAADSRLVERAYNESEVVRITGRPGVQATIAFADSETIENVAVGDSAAWQITPNKRANLLFVKPLEASARTNMTVVTSRRTYFFDLVAQAKASPVYMLRFTYKDEPAADAPAAPPVEPARPADPARLNFAWKRAGDARVLPARVYDDGASTYLVFAEKAEVPAILVRDEQGNEGPVNYAVREGTIVIGDTPGVILLRSGKAKGWLQNQNPAPAPAPASVSPPASRPVSASAPAAATPAAPASGRNIASSDPAPRRSGPSVRGN